ncbi:hypothetical protein XENOCAPTIV_000815, partial [Xenoophorus captivus]
VSVLLLSAPTGSGVSLSISPDLQQFFRDQSVKLTCEDQVGSDGSMVKKKVGSQVESCGAMFGRLSSSSCLLNEYKQFSGSYWCETRTGDRSDPVNITVSDEGLILQIPALPVITGSDVILSCKNRNQDIAAAYFFFNGRLLGSRKYKHIIHEVQQSAEGFYWCSTDEFGSSPQGLLRVRDPPSTTSRTTTRSSSCVPQVQITAPSPFNTIIFIPLIVAGASLVPLVVLVLVLVVVLWLWRKQRGHNRSSPAPDVTYAQVTFTKSANKIPSKSSSVRPTEVEEYGYTEYCDPTTD